MQHELSEMAYTVNLVICWTSVPKRKEWGKKLTPSDTGGKGKKECMSKDEKWVAKVQFMQHIFWGDGT